MYARVETEGHGRDVECDQECHLLAEDDAVLFLQDPKRITFL